MSHPDDRWNWLDLDFDADDEPEPEPLPPGWHLVYSRGHLRLAHDLPDIATYQPNT